MYLYQRSLFLEICHDFDELTRHSFLPPPFDIETTIKIVLILFCYHVIWTVGFHINNHFASAFNCIFFTAVKPGPFSIHHFPSILHHCVPFPLFSSIPLNFKDDINPKEEISWFRSIIIQCSWKIIISNALYFPR